MQITILGSGTYVPELERHCPSYLIQVGKENIVFDFGRGALGQLLKLGVDYADIDIIFITHTHADHCSELSSFLHIALAEPSFLKLMKKDIIIYGPKGLSKTVNSMKKAFNLTKFNPKFKITIKEIEDGDVISGEDWKLKSYKVKHSPDMNCLAFRLESNNKVLVYSGDSGDCQGLRNAGRNADLLILEANDPPGLKTERHMNGEKAGKLASELNVRKLVLTHISPYCLDNFDPQKDAIKYFKGDVLIAKDLMRIRV